MQNVRDQEILDNLAKQLKKIRAAKNISQEELAHRSDITLSQIARIETGRINTTVCTLVALAKALDVPPSNLLDWDN